MAACLNQISAQLESVKDKASADAAVPKLVELFAQLETLKTKVTKISAENPNAQLELRDTIIEKITGPISRFILSSANVATNNCYESEALQEFFMNQQM